MSGHRPHRIFIFISTSAFTLEEREKRKRKNYMKMWFWLAQVITKTFERGWKNVNAFDYGFIHQVQINTIQFTMIWSMTWKKMKSEPKLSGTSSRGWKDTWKCLLDLIGVDGEYSIKRSDFFGRKKMKWLNTYKHMVYFSVFKSDPEGFAAIWTTECDWKERV